MSWQDVRSFYEDPEPYEPDFKVLGKSDQTARKWHTCEHCQGGIAPGQRYESVRALDEGRFVILKYHTDREQCRAAELAREEEERRQTEVQIGWMEQQWDQELSVLCGACDGWRMEIDHIDGDRCKVCGGAGQWDSGEAFPAAFDVETTEPRIPADLTNIYRPRPRKEAPRVEIQAFDEENTPF